MNILSKQQGMDLIAAAVYLECHGGAQGMPVAEANRIAQTLRDLLSALGSQCKPGGRCERHARGLGACVAGYCNPPAPAPARQPLPFDDDVPEDLRAVLEKHFGVGAHKAWNRAASLDACMMRAAGLAAAPAPLLAAAIEAEAVLTAMSPPTNKRDIPEIVACLGRLRSVIAHANGAPLLVPCPVCGGEAVHAQDVLARTTIAPASGVAIPDGSRDALDPTRGEVKP